MATKTLRKIVKIDEEKCNGCGACAITCAEGALQIIDGKAKLISENYCDGLGACLGECPEGAITIEERVSEEFNEEAVEHHLQAKEAKLPCGCPSATVAQFETGAAHSPTTETPQQPRLRYWPVQLHWSRRAHLFYIRLTFCWLPTASLSLMPASIRNF